MPDLKPLIDAVAFVKAHPDRHDQEESEFFSTTRCIVSYAAENAGLEDIVGTDYRERLAEIIGVDSKEIESLYGECDNETAISEAENIISAYSQPKYRVGMMIRTHGNSNLYRVTDVSDSGNVKFVDEFDHAYEYREAQMQNWNPVIVENPVTPPVVDELEYVVRYGDTEIDTYSDRRDAIVAGQALRSYFEATEAYPMIFVSKVKIAERPIKPVEKEINF
jgi:hypothetical protein